MSVVVLTLAAFVAVMPLAIAPSGVVVRPGLRL